MKIELSPTALTLGDIADIEDHVGIPGSEVFEKLSDGSWSAKMFEAMVWVTARRDNPEFTVEDAKKIPLADIQMVAGEDDPLAEAE